MSLYGIDAALWNVYTSSKNTRLFTENPEAFLDRFPLYPDERAALVEKDYAALLQLGAHPFLMYKLALRVEGGFSVEFIQGYVEAIEGLKLRDIVT